MEKKWLLFLNISRDMCNTLLIADLKSHKCKQVVHMHDYQIVISRSIELCVLRVKNTASCFLACLGARFVMACGKG